MNDLLPTLTLAQLGWCLIPSVIVLWILWHWQLRAGEATYGFARMIVQLLLVGYALTYVFSARTPLLTVGVLAIMMIFAVWIALRPLSQRNGRLFAGVTLGMTAGTVSTLLFILGGVLGTNPLSEPQLLIPLGGMTFAGAMNTTSLALERFENEIGAGKGQREARVTAYKAGLIPTINSLFAVGIVSFPGTMTGQIMSGVPPHVAARYQILVMSLLFAASGISAACCLLWAGKHIAAPSPGGHPSS